MFLACNCAVHKKCHEKILGKCPGSAKESRETKVHSKLGDHGCTTLYGNIDPLREA